MSRRSEFIPVGVLVSSTRQLELDFKDQQALVYEMQATSRELENNPLITPVFREVKLGRIALADDNGRRSKTDRLYVQFSETSDGRRNAAIDIIEGDLATGFRLSPTSDEWEVWNRRTNIQTGEISSEKIVSELYPKIRNNEVFSSLLDGPALEEENSFDPMTIPHLLASYLHAQAGRAERKLRYRTSDPIIQSVNVEDQNVDTTFMSSAGTTFDVYENNGRFIHNLSTRAQYIIGRTTLEKTYSYKAETSPKTFYNAAGSVTVQSSDGYAEKQIENYAAADQVRREPLFTLHRSLASIREQYGLESETAA